MKTEVLERKKSVFRMMRHRSTIVALLRTHHPCLERIHHSYARDALKVLLIFCDDNFDAMFKHARPDENVPKWRTGRFHYIIAFITVPAFRSMIIHREDRNMSETIVLPRRLELVF